MKKILLIAALLGFVSAEAQNKNCGCRKKTVHHKTISHKTAQAPAPKTTGTWTRSYEMESGTEPCFVYRKHNIVVKQCPGTFYDNSDIETLYEFKTDRYYMGNYPQEQQPVNGPAAPQHTTIDNYKGTAPANGNACTMNCTPQ